MFPIHRIKILMKYFKLKPVGRHISLTGLDVSFDIDWVLNDDFLLTFQVTPQFNYYIFRSEI